MSPPSKNPPNLTKAIAAHDEMTRLVRLWHSSRHKRIMVPFETYGEAVNTRLMFHIWRKEAPALFPLNPEVRTAYSIRCKAPVEMEGRWYLEFIEKPLTSALGAYLDSQGMERAEPEPVHMPEPAQTVPPSPSTTPSEPVEGIDDHLEVIRKLFPDWKQ